VSIPIGRDDISPKVSEASPVREIDAKRLALARLGLRGRLGDESARQQRHDRIAVPRREDARHQRVADAEQLFPKLVSAHFFRSVICNNTYKHIYLHNTRIKIKMQMPIAKSNSFSSAKFDSMLLRICRSC
jgi:hypothetical protein